MLLNEQILYHLAYSASLSQYQWQELLQQLMHEEAERSSMQCEVLH